jgi:glutamate-ammonia-ligase adenylyltransferase
MAMTTASRAQGAVSSAVTGGPTVEELLDAVEVGKETLGRLAALGFAEPGGALQNLRRLAETPREREKLGPLLPRLLRQLQASPDPDMALNNIERLAAAAMDRNVFYTLLHDHPEALPVVVALSGSSQYLTDALIRSPQIVSWLLDPTVMRPRARGELAQAVAAACRPFRTVESQANAIRRFRRRELCRIGLRDILGDADLVTTTQELSDLADACLAQAWALVEPDLRERHGQPRHGEGEPTAFAVIALGKLGGSELNYSSDIDLCFVYDAEGQTDGPEAIPTRVYFARAVERLLAILTEMTEEGAMYRVDLRLRPEGTGGALALPLEAYRHYHQTRGRLWERQALVKARAAAGDERLGRRFMELAREIAYRPGLEREALGEIRAMKHRIDRQLRVRGGQERHVKLGVGGIRDIEFHVQALQLLFGGTDPWLRERATLRALHRLAERGYLAWEEARGLGHAYEFLRIVEHRLQILHALQTHTLPADPAELHKLARRLGYTGGPEVATARFQADYDQTRRRVRTAFDDFFASPGGDRNGAGPPWTEGAVAAVGFADPERARQNLRLIWEGPPLVPAPAAARAVLATLLPTTLAALPAVADPDGALDALERFVAAAGPRMAYLDRLARMPALLGRLLSFFTRSERLTQTLITRPELLEPLADTGSLATRRPAAALRAAFTAFEAPGLDGPDRLRSFKQAEELRIAWQDLVGGAPAARTGWALTELAEACLGLGWEWAEAEVRGPAAAIAGRPAALVVGMGKLGGRELDYGSDLDLVVLHEAEGTLANGQAAHAYFDQVVDRLYALLTAITRTGQAFRVDLRLRQGGKGTALSHALPALRAYLEGEAALWERQALVKARPVYGDLQLARAFQALRRTHVFGPGLSDAERAEIHHVRGRMELELGKEGPGRIHLKFGRGGLIDIEFLAQVLQLTHGRRHGALRTPSTRRALRSLARLRLLPTATVEGLLAAYDFYKALLRSLRLRQTRPPDCLPVTGQVLARLAREHGCPSGRALLERHREVAGFVRARYEEVLR